MLSPGSHPLYSLHWLAGWRRSLARPLQETSRRPQSGAAQEEYQVTPALRHATLCPTCALDPMWFSLTGETSGGRETEDEKTGSSADGSGKGCIEDDRGEEEEIRIINRNKE